MGLLRWILGFLIAILITAFAVANRQSVDMYWSPFNAAAHFPLYLIVLSFTATGFLIGAFIVSLNSLPLWFFARRQKRQIKKLEKELESAGQSEHKDATGFLKLPGR